MPPRDLASLLDMLVAARTIRQYLAGATLSTFEQDAMRQDAVMRQFEILGEAAGRISDATRAHLSDIPWRRIVGMRNTLIHAYDHVDIDEVWAVAERDLPTLIARLTPLVPPEDTD